MSVTLANSRYSEFALQKYSLPTALKTKDITQEAASSPTRHEFPCLLPIEPFPNRKNTSKAVVGEVSVRNAQERNIQTSSAKESYSLTFEQAYRVCGSL